MQSIAFKHALGDHSQRHCHIEQVEAVIDRGEAKALESRSRALSGKTGEASKTR
jgi:hypothetical protein